MAKQFYFQESTSKIMSHSSERTWNVQMTIKNLKKIIKLIYGMTYSHSYIQI